VTESQPGSDIEKKKHKPQGQADGLEIQQPPEYGGCPECHVKTARIRELEMRLMDQEEEARQHEKAAIMHQQDLAGAHVVEVRKQLSSQINELEAQQSGQASTSGENTASRPLPPDYYCDDCSWTRKQLSDAEDKSRMFRREFEIREWTIRHLEHNRDQARDERKVLQQRLDEANVEISRLWAQLGPRTSKL